MLKFFYELHAWATLMQRSKPNLNIPNSTEKNSIDAFSGEITILMFYGKFKKNLFIC